MSSKALLGGLLIGGVIGYAVANPVPEVVTVKDPAPPARVITETEVVEKLVRVPVPEECRDNIVLTDQLVDEMNRWNNAARAYYNQLDAVDQESITDQTANNDLVVKTFEILKDEESSLYAIFNLQHSITTQQKLCKDALESAP